MLGRSFHLQRTNQTVGRAREEVNETAYSKARCDGASATRGFVQETLKEDDQLISILSIRLPLAKPGWNWSSLDPNQ